MHTKKFTISHQKLTLYIDLFRMKKGKTFFGQNYVIPVIVRAVGSKRKRGSTVVFCPIVELSANLLSNIFLLFALLCAPVHTINFLGI